MIQKADPSTFFRIEEGDIVAKKHKKGLTFHYMIGIPQVTDTPLALNVEHDGYNSAHSLSFARLYYEGLVPPCVQIGVSPGNYVFPDGSRRNMRLDCYDLFSSEYGDFLVEELIPALIGRYGLNVSPDPDYHMISGGSSGGISAFLAAWFHPEYFHRVYMSSPSFLAMGRGNEIPYLVRKYESRPLKIFAEYSENEPDDYFGSSECIDKEMIRALHFAGYDMNAGYFGGEGHCSRLHDSEEAYNRLKWLWEAYQTKPIRKTKNSVRVDDVIPIDSVWEKADSFPKEKPTHRVISSDRRMLYCADVNLDELWKHPFDQTGNPDQSIKFAHGFLHTIPCFYPKGAIDIAIDRFDRLYVLTSIGIQCVRSFGLIDAILYLPPKGKAEMISIKGNRLFVKTDDGIWSRTIRSSEIGNDASEPRFTDYYDRYDGQ